MPWQHVGLLTEHKWQRVAQVNCNGDMVTEWGLLFV
jgi:hypothetical protein